MKKLLLFLVTLLITIVNHAQQGINYKAIIADGGIAVQNTAVTVYFTILENGVTTIYEESHSTTTDANGIVILNIGEGTVTSGDFSTINWSLEHFLNVKVNAGSGITDMGTNAFKTVPYAKYAEKSANAGATEINELTDAKYDNTSLFLGSGSGTVDDGGNFNVAVGKNALSDNISGLDNSSVGFEALSSNTTGSQNTTIGNYSLPANTIGGNNVAVGYETLAENISGNENTGIGFNALFENISGNYNTAIGLGAGYSSLGDANIFLGYYAGANESGSNKLYIENTNASSDNALIYGEFGTDNTTTGNILRTNSQFQIGNPASTGYKFPTARGTADQILQTNDSGTLTWINSSSLGVQKINDLTDGKSDNDGTENGSSIFLGIDAGLNDDQTDNKNVGIGFESLKNNTTGYFNSAIGYRSLGNNTSGHSNVANGFASMFMNTTGYFNTAIGIASLNRNTSGFSNTAIGYDAMVDNDDGNMNTAIGYESLADNQEGDDNSAIGDYSLRRNISGDYNVAVGSFSMYSKYSGIGNIALGSYSGYNNDYGDKNIFLGYRAGYNETGDDKLYIENSDSATPLIGGDFATDEVTINGGLEVTQKLTAPHSGATDMKAYIYGSHQNSGVASTNGAQSGGYSVSQTGTGVYDVTFTNSPGNTQYTVITSMRNNNTGFISVLNSTTKFTISTFNTSGVAANKAFNFVVYKK